MRKTYKSNAAKLRLVVEVRGERMGIEFGWDIVSQGGAMGCSYSTEDEAVQAAIEQSGLFGNKVWCERPPLTQEPPSNFPFESTPLRVACEDPATEEADRAEQDATINVCDTPIKNIAEARKVLREQYSKSAEETKTKVQVLTLLNELGLKYSIKN